MDAARPAPGSTTSASPCPTWSEASRFLVDVLGCEYLYSLGPFARRRRRLDGRAPQRPPAA